MLKVLLVLGLQLYAAEVSLASSSSTSLPASLAAPEAGRSRERSQLRHLQARRNPSSSCTPVCSSGGCMPQIYLIGAQKAGSSSMFSMLMQDSSSCGSNMPGFYHKETHLLSGNETHNSSGLTREMFTSVFRLEDCNSRCFVEATPANIRSRKAPRILFGLMTAAERAASKFLLVVREPVRA